MLDGVHAHPTCAHEGGLLYTRRCEIFCLVQMHVGLLCRRPVQVALSGGADCASQRIGYDALHERQYHANECLSG